MFSYANKGGIMHPHLTDNSYIKIKPDCDIASFVLNKNRTNLDINETASEILRYCNGYYDIEEIIKNVSINHNLSLETAKINVEEFLLPLIELNAVIDKKETKNKSFVKGSKEIYYPDSIIWELTTQCPLRCKHCYLPNKDHNFINRNEIDEILNIIDRTGVYSVQLTGGEAFLHSEIEYIVDYLIDSDIQIALSTSGMIQNSLAKNVVKKICGHGNIRVSIDGPELYHNEIRQNNNAFKHSIDFIHYAISQHVICQVATVLINQPMEMIEEHVKSIRDMGVSLLAFSPVSIQGEAKRNQIDSTYNMAQVNEIIETLNKKYSTDTFMIQTSVDDPNRNCGCGHKVIRIRPDLTITPCPMIESNMGSLKEKNYEEILKDKAKICHDHYSPGSELCKDCDKKSLCGKCTAFALHMKEDYHTCRWAKTQPEFISCL